MVELSSLPPPSSLVRGINLAQAVGLAPNLGCAYSIITGQLLQNTVIVIAKPTNTELTLLLPVENATVEVSVLGVTLPFALSKTKKWSTPANGIVSIGCFYQYAPQGYTVRVLHPNVDFGNGKGQYSSSIRRTTFNQTTPIIIQGDMDIPCDTSTFPTPPLLSNWELGSVPTITMAAPFFNMPGYGAVFGMNARTGIVASLFINGKKVYEANTKSNEKIPYTFPDILQNILLKTTPFKSPLAPGSTMEVYMTITLGSCQRSSNVIRIAIPPLPTIPTPSEICKAVSTRLNSINGAINPPSILLPTGSNFLSIKGLEEFCNDPTNPKYLNAIGLINKAGIGKITLGDLPSANFDIFNGAASIDLSRIFSLTSLFPTIATGGLPAPSLGTIPQPTSGAGALPPGISLSTRFSSAGTSLAQVQAFLPPGYTAQPSGFGGAGTYKITRPNGTYFYAQSFGSINDLIHIGGG